MDAARVAHSHSQTAAKACTFRYNAAVDTFNSSKTAFRAALTNLKAGKTAEAKAAADKAGAEMMAADKASDEAEATLKAAEAEEEKAKQLYNAACAARSRRINKHDKHEVALPAGDAPVKQSAAEYIRAAETAFADLYATSSFPEPEASPCGNTSCLRNTKNRALAACPCNVKAALKDLSGKELKTAKKTFSAERFAGNADFQAKASEICSAIDKVIAAQTLNQQPRNQQGKAFDKSRRNQRGH